MIGSNTNANHLEKGTNELERYALEECIKRQRVDRQASVLITPAGHCELAIEFARLGARTTVADEPSYRQDVTGRLLASGFRDEVAFAACTLADLPDELPGEPFDIIVVRRGLCSMPYEEARLVVRQLLLRLKIGGKLYLSVLGLHSELGETYPDSELPVNQRYSKLGPDMEKKYGIDQPVCLYTERNLFMLLLEAGASVLRTLTSTYGNVKGVAVRV